MCIYSMSGWRIDQCIYKAALATGYYSGITSTAATLTNKMKEEVIGSAAVLVLVFAAVLIVS